MAEIEDLSELRVAQLITAYNAGQDLLGRSSDSHVSRFRSGEAAVMAVSALRQKLRSMHRHAWLDLSGDAVSWQTTRAPQVQQDRPRVSDSPEARVSTTALPTKSRLHVLAVSNPKRPGTRAWETFDIYYQLPEGATGETYVRLMVAAGHTRRLALSTLHWDIRHGYVRLGDSDA